MQSAFVKVDMSMTGAAISTSIPNTSDNELSQRSPRPFSEAILARADGMCAMDAASRRKEAATSSTGTYITAATHKAQLTGILVDGTAVKGFDPASICFG